uniref:Uncharacterized protein n=1 Tax=Trichogramma kaykai TaxID=54128 RepID=A0ABD2WMC6_9HYME
MRPHESVPQNFIKLGSGNKNPNNKISLEQAMYYTYGRFYAWRHTTMTHLRGRATAPVSRGKCRNNIAFWRALGKLPVSNLEAKLTAYEWYKTLISRYYLYICTSRSFSLSHSLFARLRDSLYRNKLRVENQNSKQNISRKRKFNFKTLKIQ